MRWLHAFIHYYYRFKLSIRWEHGLPHTHTRRLSIVPISNCHVIFNSLSPLWFIVSCDVKRARKSRALKISVDDLSRSKKVNNGLLFIRKEIKRKKKIHFGLQRISPCVNQTKHAQQLHREKLILTFGVVSTCHGPSMYKYIVQPTMRCIKSNLYERITWTNLTDIFLLEICNLIVLDFLHIIILLWILCWSD